MSAIRKRGDSYQAQIRRTGFSGTSRTFPTLAEARKWAKEQEERLDMGLPIEGVVSHSPHLSIALTRYANEVSALKKGSERENVFLSALGRHRLAARPIDSITAADIAAFRDERLKAVSPGTVKREMTILRHVFEVSRREWELVKSNPVDLIRLPRENQPRDRRLEPDELARLMSACDACRNQTIREVILFAIETGMRRSEIVGSTWENVNWKRRTLYLPDTKNGLPRTVPLSKQAMSILTKLKPEKLTGPVFRITANALQLSWERVRRRAGITDLHFHDLRHEAISRFFEKGLTVPEAQVVSGHKDLRMLSRYTHLRAEDIVNKLG